MYSSFPGLGDIKHFVQFPKEARVFATVRRIHPGQIFVVTSVASFRGYKATILY